MIQFNELRITPDSKHLIIDTQVQDLPYYEGITIKAIIVDTQKSFSITGPAQEDKNFWREEYSGSKHVRTVIDIDSVSNNLFFVYVLTDGDTGEGAPCGNNLGMVLGVVYDKKALYNNIMPYLRQMEGCDVGSTLLDKILQFTAFNISLRTCNYLQAIEYWNKFYAEGKGSKTVKSGCGCHGRR